VTAHADLAAFKPRRVVVDGVEIAAWTAGSGDPVLLLHGYPQTHMMWHRVAPRLARTRTVVLADLRGYGESAKPPGGENEAAYGKRAMAADMAGLMGELGFDTFDVVGHDRGARVTHRLCLDHPGLVRRAAVLDVVPTRHMFATVDRAFGLAYFHWFFLAQAPDLPERMIGADPEGWVRHAVGAWSQVGGAFDDEAVSEYVRCFADPEAIRASCDDYRAGAGIDLVDDDATFAEGTRVTCPLLVLWGGRGFVGAQYDVPAVWRNYATDVTAVPLDCGHFLPEERPDETYRAVQEFLSAR
jgi:haloacetate dehalogenase